MIGTGNLIVILVSIAMLLSPIVDDGANWRQPSAKPPKTAIIENGAGTSLCVEENLPQTLDSKAGPADDMGRDTGGAADQRPLP
jgi:hypothetical protein